MNARISNPRSVQPAPSGPRREPLTKRLMFDLTEGVFVTGNVLLGNGSGGYVPNFSVRVSGNRAALWKQAVLTKANGRLCTIHETQADLDAHIQRLARTFAETNHTNN